MLRLAAAIIVAACGLNPVRAAEVGCANDQAYHRLDFWLGAWDVYVDGVLDGRNDIVSLLGGCAIQENWSDASGYEGKSWFYVDASTHRLKQVWITSVANQPGGTKEKVEVASADEHSLRLQGTQQGADGKPLFDRTTLTPRADGSVRQLIELSRDGIAWKTVYDALYKAAKR